MKKKYLTAAVCTAVMMICVGLTAAAAENTGYDRETGYAFIFGQTGWGGNLVTVEVLRPGRQWGELEAAAPLQALEMLAYFNQIKADSAGKFSVSWQMEGVSGAYPVRIYNEAEKKRRELQPILFASQTDMDGALQTVNAAKTAEVLMASLERNIIELGIDLSVYHAYTSEKEKADFRMTLFAEKNKQIQAVFPTVDAVKTALAAAEQMTAVNNASAEALGVLIETLDFGAQESYNIYTDGGIYSETKKQTLLSSLTQGMSLATLEDFGKRFGEAVVLYGCWQNDSWGAVQKVIAQSALLQGYDLGKYNSLTDQSAVCKTINASAAPYSSLADLAAAIKAAAGNGGTGGNAGGNSSGTGSGNGGGKASGSQYSVAPIVPSLPTPTVTPTDSAFSDMQGYEWAGAAVTALSQQGIVSGRGDGCFAPGDLVTREEFVKLLVGALDLYDGSAETALSDVQKDAWYYRYVASAMVRGIARGTGEGRFGVGETITRQDMATMVYNALQLADMPLPGDTKAFSDEAEIAGYALQPVKALAEARIVNGVGDGLFAPKNSVNRASAAQIIFNLMVWRGQNG